MLKRLSIEMRLQQNSDSNSHTACPRIASAKFTIPRAIRGALVNHKCTHTERQLVWILGTSTNIFSERSR